MPDLRTLTCAAILAMGCTVQKEARTRQDSAAPASTAAEATRPPAVTSAWQVRPDGADPIRIGMNAADARRALALPPAGRMRGCAYLVGAPQSPLHGYVMLTNDTVVRIDVRDSVLATAEGARVGDSESRILRLYVGRIAVQPHKYLPDGHYLVVTEPGDAANRIIFETDGNVVTTYRAGRRPEVENVEGCG